MPNVTKQSARPTPKVSTPISPPSKQGGGGGEGDDGWGKSDGMRILIYGDSGTGKTTLAATFPGPIRWLICSGGNRPGELKSVDTPENRKKIRPLVIHSTSQFLDEVSLLRGGTYTTVVLDHSSGLLNLLTKEMLGMDSIPAVKNWGMAQQRDWGNINEKMIELLRDLLNLPGNVIVIGQERIFRGKEDGNSISDIIRPSVGVSLTPGVTNWLRPVVDYEVQTFKRPRMVKKTYPPAIKGQPPLVQEERGKGVDYCIRCEEHDVFFTKFRLPKEQKKPDVIVDPSYEKLLRVIRGEE